MCMCRYTVLLYLSGCPEKQKPNIEGHSRHTQAGSKVQAANRQDPHANSTILSWPLVSSAITLSLETTRITFLPNPKTVNLSSSCKCVPFLDKFFFCETVVEANNGFNKHPCGRESRWEVGFQKRCVWNLEKLS